jgi:hypothetical protein
MRSIKILLTLSVLFPFTAQSQKWEFRAGGGATFMTLPHGVKIFDDLGKDNKMKAAITAAGFLSVGHQLFHSHFVAGLRLGVASLKRVTDKDIPGGYYNQGRYITYSKPVGVYVGAPSLWAQPFLSYRYKSFYGGVQAGIISYIGEGPVDPSASRFEGHDVQMIGTPFVGFAGGLHAGYQLQIIEHWGVFADLSCNYISCRTAYDPWLYQQVRFFQPQAIVGLCYVRK